MSIRDWPEGERPREKLLKLGAGALSEAELIAIFLRTGVRGRSALDVARDLLNQFGSVRGLLTAETATLCKAPGMGAARYATLQAVLELARRHYQELMQTGPALLNPQATRDYLHMRLRDLPHEVFCCLYLDNRHRVIACEELFRGTLDGAEFQGSSASGQQAVLGEHRLLPDFEAGVMGMKPGESKAFDVRFPGDYQSPEVAGKTARFEVTLSHVAAPRLPEVDAGFAKSLGVADGDLGTMRAEIRANLEREVKAKLRSRLRDQAMQALLDATRIDAPRSLVQIEIERMKAGARQELAARGVKVTEETPLPVDLFEQQARRRVNLGLILGEVVRAHNLYAKPEQVRGLVEEQAQSYERPEEVVKWFYAEPERLRDIESAALEDNVVAWALGVAKVTDKTMDFDDLMGKQ